MLLVALLGAALAASAEEPQELKVKGISRAKGELKLTLKNGKKKTYKDNPQEGQETFIEHAVVDHIEKNNIVVIEQSFYEGGQFLVVSMKDGSEIVTQSKPVWSAEKNNFISVNDDESGYTDNQVLIGTCKKMKCSKVFSEAIGSGNAKWIDEKTVEFEKRKFDPATGQSEAKMRVCKIDKKVTCSNK